MKNFHEPILELEAGRAGGLINYKLKDCLIRTAMELKELVDGFEPRYVPSRPIECKVLDKEIAEELSAAWENFVKKIEEAVNQT